MKIRVNAPVIISVDDNNSDFCNTELDNNRRCMFFSYDPDDCVYGICRLFNESMDYSPIPRLLACINLTAKKTLNQ